MHKTLLSCYLRSVNCLNVPAFFFCCCLRSDAFGFQKQLSRCRCVSSTIIHFIPSFLPHIFFFLPAHTLSQQITRYSCGNGLKSTHPLQTQATANILRVQSARAFLSGDSAFRYSFQHTTLYRIVTKWCAENSLGPSRRLCIKTSKLILRCCVDSQPILKTIPIIRMPTPSSSMSVRTALVRIDQPRCQINRY